MKAPRKSRRVETREFWKAAVQLWAESGLSVREFCSQEGLAEHTFYSWRRELMPENAAIVVNQAPSAIKGETPTDDRRQRPTAGPVDTNTTAVEFLPVRVVGDEGSHSRVASLDMLAETSPIEIIGASPWRVRLLGGFIPAALDAVLTVLEERPC